MKKVRVGIIGSGSNLETRERDDVETWGIGLQLDWLEWKKQEWIAGLEIYRDGVNSWRFNRNVDTGERWEMPGRFPDGARYLSSALYAQATVRASPRADFVLGSRYSFFDVDAWLADQDQEYNSTFDQLVSSATVLVRPSRRFHVSGGVHQGFRAHGSAAVSGNDGVEDSPVLVFQARVVDF